MGGHDPRTAQPLDSLATALRDEIESRLGRVPAFFEPALANPEVLWELWRQTRVAWLDSPVPRVFRLTLLDLLAEHSPWPWAEVARAAGPSGVAPTARSDNAALLEAAAQPIEPAAPASRLPDWPQAGTAEFDELLVLTLRLLLDSPEQEVRQRLVALLGPRRYASLISAITYLESCRVFTQAHPDIDARASSRLAWTHDPRKVALVELDFRGVITSLSPRAENLFGLTASEARGRVATELLSEGGHTLANLIDEFGAETDAPLREQSFTATGARTGGSAFDATVTVANRGRDGEPGKMTVVVEGQPAGATASENAAAYDALAALLARGSKSVAADDLLAAVAQVLGWTAMLIWRWEPRDQVLHCVSIRHLDDNRDRQDLRERAANVVAPGADMVGRVFESRTPIWEDLPETDAVATGLWLPLGGPDGVNGVLELLSSAPRSHDPDVLETLSALTREGAAVLERSASDEAVITPEAAARVAFEGVAVGTALVTVEGDKPGVIAQANTALGLLTGKEPSDLTGSSLDDLTHPEDVLLDAELRAQLLAATIPAYEVVKRFRRGADFFWGELSVSLVRSELDGRPLYLVVQLADITERKQVEDALQASRDRLASAFDEAPIGMALVALDYQWLEANEALCETFGYSEPELLTKRLADVIVPEEVETLQRYVQQLLAGNVLGYHVETRAVRGDGEVIWIQLSISLVHGYSGEPAYLLAEVQDISERKRLEEELEQGALVDALTGLPSRALLFDRLDRARAQVARTSAPFAVMLVAVEGLDAVRTAFGPERRDGALRELAARLVASVRAVDTVARYGDEEFVIVCGELADSNSDATAIAERLLKLGRFAVSEEDIEIEVGATIGITVATSSDEPAAGSIERADVAIQAARGEGVGLRLHCDATMW